MGGTEILNQQRAFHYAKAADCPAGWFKLGDCQGLDEALGDLPYQGGLISDAPWYDEDDEATHRFYGAYPLELKGLSDSTRTASITEGIADGGVIQGVRRSVKQVRARAVLMAQGQDALEAGLNWLDAALELQACSTHAGTCGEVDACFFTACPPTRDDVTVKDLVFAPVTTNLFPQPTPRTAALWDAVGMEKTFVTDPFEGDYVRGEVNAPGFAFFNLTTPATRIPVIPGEALTFQAGVRLGITAAAAVMRLLWMTANGTFISSGTQDGVPTMSHDWTRIAVTATPPVGAVWAGVYILLASDQPMGATLDVRRVMAERGDEVSPFFDGTSTPSEYERFTWKGEENNSASVHEIAEFVDVPDDVLYDLTIDGLRRVMHGVVTISGPIVMETLHRDEFWGYVVEFTVAAATPYIYSLTKEIPLDSSISTVYADVPYNLIPYASVGVVGPEVTVATNYATNPSVEVNTTGWSFFTSSGLGAGSAAFSTSVAAEGARSYRVVATPSSSGTLGAIAGRYTVSFPNATAQTRMSITVWAYGVDTASYTPGTKTVTATWRNGGVDNGITIIGTQWGGGSGPISMSSIDVPSGADSVMIEVDMGVTSWDAGATIELYIDAVALTIP